MKTNKGKYLKSFDGANIYYDADYAGDRWLIFLHGLGGDLTAWKKERLYFKSIGLSTIAVDLRGHGLSSRGKEKNFYKLANFSRDISALIETEKIKHGILIGHCFGGMISINLGATSPNLLKSFVLIDTSYKPPFFGNNFVEHTLLKIILDLFATCIPEIRTKGHANFLAFKGTQDIDFKRLLSDILHTSLRSYLLICENLVDYNALDLLQKITKPTLVIDGTSDSIFPPNIAEELKERIKRSELDLIEGANHILILNNPVDLNKSIHSFIKKINFI